MKDLINRFLWRKIAWILYGDRYKKVFDRVSPCDKVTSHKAHVWVKTHRYISTVEPFYCEGDEIFAAV